MKLNELRLAQEEIIEEDDVDGVETEFTNNYSEINNEPYSSNSGIENENCGNFKNVDNNTLYKSKWDIFLDKKEESHEEEEEEPETNFTWEVNNKKRKRSDNKVETSKKKLLYSHKHEVDVKPKSVNNQKLNHTENFKISTTVQNVSKWGMYLNSQDNCTDEETSKHEKLFDAQEDDDLDEILKL